MSRARDRRAKARRQRAPHPSPAPSGHGRRPRIAPAAAIVAIVVLLAAGGAVVSSLGGGHASGTDEPSSATRAGLLPRNTLGNLAAARRKRALKAFAHDYKAALARQRPTAKRLNRLLRQVRSPHTAPWFAKRFGGLVHSVHALHVKLTRLAPPASVAAAFRGYKATIATLEHDLVRVAHTAARDDAPGVRSSVLRLSAHLDRSRPVTTALRRKLGIH